MKKGCTVLRDVEGQGFWLISDLVRLLVEHDGYDAVTIESPIAGGPPPHLHTREDELFYVVRGRYRFALDKHAFEGGPGTCVFLPRGVVHSFSRAGDSPGKLMMMATPGGFAGFAAQAGVKWGPDSHPPEPGPALFARVGPACEAFGIEIRPDWQADLPAPAQPKPRELWVVGLHIRILLTGERTGGSFSVVEITALPGGFVPRHYHHREDEMFYVLEGAFEFDLDGRKLSVTTGTLIHIPRKTLHGFRNIGAGNGKLLNYHTPGGFDRFFEASGTVCEDFSQGPPTTPVDFDRFVRICNEHGMEVPR